MVVKHSTRQYCRKLRVKWCAVVLWYDRHGQRTANYMTTPVAALTASKPTSVKAPCVPSPESHPEQSFCSRCVCKWQIVPGHMTGIIRREAYVEHFISECLAEANVLYPSEH